MTITDVNITRNTASPIDQNSTYIKKSGNIVIASIQVNIISIFSGSLTVCTLSKYGSSRYVLTSCTRGTIAEINSNGIISIGSPSSAGWIYGILVWTTPDN